jgi:hypothetical protein
VVLYACSFGLERHEMNSKFKIQDLKWMEPAAFLIEGFKYYI